MPKRQRDDDEGNLLLVITCRCMLCSEIDSMATIEASIALAEQLQAAEEEGRLKRQKQEEDDAKMVMAMHKIECVCSLSLSLSLCRNPDYDSADLAEHYRLASPGKFREAGASAEEAAPAAEEAAPATCK